MTNNQPPETYAILKNDTPFDEIFPDKKVPVCSLVPIVLEDSPPCYVVSFHYLAKEQIAELAALVYKEWEPECTSLEMAIQTVEKGLFLNCDYFVGVTTTDYGQFMQLVDEREA